MSNTQTDKAQDSAPKQLTQGEAVVQAVRDVLKADYKEGVKVVLTDDQRKAVTDLLVKGFKEHRIPLKPSPANTEKLADAEKLHAYVKGLLQNWLVKSHALNGKPKRSNPALTAAASTEAKPEAKTPEQTKTEKEAVVTSLSAKKPPVPAGKK